MKFVAFGQSFDRDNRFLISVSDRGHTGGNTFSAHQHRTSAALPLATTVLCAGKLQILAQHIQQGSLGISRYSLGFSIDRESNGRVHNLRRAVLEARESSVNTNRSMGLGQLFATHRETKGLNREIESRYFGCCSTSNASAFL